MAKRPVSRRKGTSSKPASPGRPRAAAGAVRRATGAGSARRGNVDRPGTRPVPANFHALYDRGYLASRGLAAATVARTPVRAPAGLQLHLDEATQLPNMVIVSAGASSGARARAGATVEAAAIGFVRSRAQLWRLSKADAATIEVVSVSQPRAAVQGQTASRTGGARSSFSLDNLRTVRLIQRAGGVEVFNSDATAAVGAANQVISIAGQFFPGAAMRAVATRSRAAAARRSSPEDAIATAAFDLTNVTYAAGDFMPVEGNAPGEAGGYRFYAFRPAKGDRRPRFERTTRVKEVLFPFGEGQFVAGYYLELWLAGYPAFSYVMDAVDSPDVLYRKNLTSHAAFTYRVHNTGDLLFRPEDGPAPGTPHPTGKPDGFQAKPIPERLIAVESLLPGDPWLPPGATTTDGNNCTAYADLRSPNGFGAGDVKGRVSAPRTFDYTYDHRQAASDAVNLQNSLVGMFVHVNWLHDRWYEAGFDEASGNAQKNNFGRGGLGGDPVLAEGNDFSGTDNANMSTPADGVSPRMQMYEFTGTTPTRTSNHEALITFHEMGHYVTNRLVGNANGLTNVQGQAMGEGWGDFFAICMTSQSTDDFARGAFAVGGWTDLAPGFTNNYYFSIRRYPYSADLTRNPLTFKHISNNVVLPAGPPIQASSAGNNEVHNAGEVWCAALWQAFVNLVAKRGHAAAEKRMLAYVIGGLKLTPIRPTFLQARDGILTAVGALDATDLPAVRAGFATRGMGQGAVAPPSTSSTLAGVVESFTP